MRRKAEQDKRHDRFDRSRTAFVTRYQLSGSGRDRILLVLEFGFEKFRRRRLVLKQVTLRLRLHRQSDRVVDGPWQIVSELWRT